MVREARYSDGLIVETFTIDFERWSSRWRLLTATARGALIELSVFQIGLVDDEWHMPDHMPILIGLTSWRQLNNVLRELEDQGWVKRRGRRIRVCTEIWHPSTLSVQRSRTAYPQRNEMRQRRAQLYSRLAERDGDRCAKCGDVGRLHVDHIVAVSNGGTNRLSNLQLLCKTCNMKKGTKTIDYRHN